VERFGLDFGTTNTTLARVRGDGTSELVPMDPRATDPHVLRSLLYYSLEAREFVVGQQAVDEYLAEGMAGVLIQSIKTFLADESFEETFIHDRYWTLEELIAVLFRRVRAVIHACTTDDVALVVGRPAVFIDRPEREELARTRIRRAAARAGFDTVTFAYEPIAAGLAYEATLDQSQLVLIADLGGGTSDFTLMRLGGARGGDRAADILATGGVQIGGDSFDATIMTRRLAHHFGSTSTYRSMEGRELPFPAHVTALLGRWHQVPFLRGRKMRDLLGRVRFASSDPEAIDRLEGLVEGNLAFFLFDAIEGAKARLSSVPTTTLAFDRGGIALEERLSRGALDALTSDDRTRVAACLDRVLGDAGVEAGQVEAVFLTGGSAQMPALRELFVARFGDDRLRARDYLTTVASGLALCGG